MTMIDRAAFLRAALRAAVVGVAVLAHGALAGPARAEGGGGPVLVPAGGQWWAYPSPCPPGPEYLPAVPIAESRSAILVPVTPPSPFVGSEGEAGTPRCGLVSVQVQRLSDERVLQDDRGNVWASDGEVQLTRVEYVSRRLEVRPGRWRIPVHVGGTIEAYSLHGALFDGLRNWVEETFLGGDPPGLGHDIGGRELSVTTPAGDKEDLLGGTPMLKVKAFAKFPLPDWRIGCTALSSAVSLGLTTPAFGTKSDTGNSSFQPEVVVAWALPFWKLRWTGAATAAWAGGSDRYDALGLGHEDWVFGAHTNLEWWVSRRFAIALGVSWASAYTSNTGLPMDLDSVYGNLGILYRLNRRSDLHLTFSENLESYIITAPGQDYSDSQKESDFSLMLGWRMAL